MREHYVVTGVEQVVGDLGGVEGRPRDVEPEPDPLHREGELGGVLVPVVRPAVLGPEVRRIDESSRLVVDQRADDPDLPGLGRESGRAPGDLLAVLHLHVVVAEVLERGLVVLALRPRAVS